MATQIIFFCCKIRGKQYSSSDSGQSVAKIPTLEEIGTKCHSHNPYDLNYWTSTSTRSGYSWHIGGSYGQYRINFDGTIDSGRAVIPLIKIVV